MRHIMPCPPTPPIFAHPHKSFGKFSHSFDRLRRRGIELYSCCGFHAFFCVVVEALGLHAHVCTRRSRVPDMILPENSPSASRAPPSLPSAQHDIHSDDLQMIYCFLGSHGHSGHLGEQGAGEVMLARVLVPVLELALVVVVGRRLEQVEAEAGLFQRAWKRG